MARKRTIRSSSASYSDELRALQARGVSLPRNPARAATAAAEMGQLLRTPGQLRADIEAGDRPAAIEATNFAQRGIMNASALEKNAELVASMRKASAPGMRRYGTTSDVTAAIPRFYDPMEYWDLSGLPFNMADEGHRHRLHKWMRLYYATHPIVPTLVDIFTRFPLSGLELYSKDKKLTQFYEDLFLDNSKLNYEDFLVSLGREYWLVGEAFPLASFNESLGVWEDEELLNPEDIVIERLPMMRAQYLKVKPPEYMKRLVTTKSPPREYEMLMNNMPELVPYLLRGKPFPVSPVLLKHIAFKLSDWDDHGTPLLLRAMRTLIHEERLLASQDAIAERLYSPLILAKLGIQDMGNGQGPYIPNAGDLEQLRDDLDLALASDFRLLVHHFALDVQNAFGRETMPDLGNDFDRIDARLMQVFGMNPSLLAGGDNSSPYATSALAAEFLNQMLRTYQRFLKEHFRQRALIVAEAQEHWDYEKRGNTRIPIMEEVVEFDEEGNATVEQKHKLLVPEMEMATLDMRDEATERQFLMALRTLGVPISDERLMVGVQFEWEDSLDELMEEAIQKTVGQQMAKVQTYKICLQSGIPIPPDLKAEVESIQAPGAGGATPPMGSPGDMGAPGGADVGVPPQGGQFVMPPVPDDIAGQLGPGPTPGGGPVPASPGGPAGGFAGAPDISSERRPGMPSMSHTNPPPREGSTLTVNDCDNIIKNCREALIRVEVSKRERYASVKKRTTVDPNEPEEKWSTTESVVIELPQAKQELKIQRIIPMDPAA